MIPIGEEIETRRRTPYATLLLIVACVGIWLALGGPDPAATQAAAKGYGLVPNRFLGNVEQGWTALITYQFLHANFLHLATNMLFLWVFGRGLEHELGGWFLPFYLLSGAMAGVASALTRAGVDTPTIGASGAISGLMGAYLVLLPNASIRALVLVPWFFIVQVLRGDRPILDVPAWGVILTWFVLQVGESLAPNALRSGVDNAAHVGGFLAGYVVIRVVRAWFGLWPDEPGYRRILDVPAAEGAPLPSAYVRARRVIQPNVPIQREDLEWLSRDRGYVDPDAVPGYEGSRLIGRRLKVTRYRYEPICWHDLLPPDEAALPSGTREEAPSDAPR